MDANTRFVLEKIDQVERRIFSEFAQLRAELKELQSFRQRVVGASFFVSFICTAAIEIVVQLMRH